MCAFASSPTPFLQMTGFIGRLASSRVLTTALVGGAAVTGIGYYASRGAEAGASPGIYTTLGLQKIAHTIRTRVYRRETACRRE